MPQNKIAKKLHVFNFNSWSYERNTPNFQWNLPSKTREQDDQTLKTSYCEITFCALRLVSMAIVTYYVFL